MASVASVSGSNKPKSDAQGQSKAMQSAVDKAAKSPPAPPPAKDPKPAPDQKPAATAKPEAAAATNPVAAKDTAVDGAAKPVPTPASPGDGQLAPGETSAATAKPQAVAATKPTAAQEAAVDKAGADAIATYREQARTPEGRQLLTRALSGKAGTDLPAAERTKIETFLNDLSADKVKAPEFNAAAAGQAADVKTGNPALGNEILLHDVNGAYVGAGTNQALINSNLMNPDGTAKAASGPDSLRDVAREEAGEAIAFAASKAGIVLGEGDVGARLALAVDGKDPLLDAQLSSARPGDVTTVRVGGQVLQAAANTTSPTPAPNAVDPATFVAFGDNNGSLANWELQGALAAQGTTLDMERVNRLMSSFDVQRDGVVDEAEVANMVSSGALKSFPTWIEVDGSKVDAKAFAGFGDNNGSLANWELQGALKERGLDLAIEPVNDLAGRYDGNKDGVVDATEINTMFADRALTFRADGTAEIPGTSSVQAASVTPASLPFAADYADYVNKTALPGKDGTISQLTFRAMLEEYKDAEEGSKGRQMYDLLLAKQFLQDGYTDNDRFNVPLSGAEVGDNVLDGAAVDAQFNALMADPAFKSEYETKFREKLDQTIKDNFIVFEGKITLFDPSNRAHTTVDRQETYTLYTRGGPLTRTRTVSDPANHPRVDLAAFSDAMKASVNNQTNVDAYRTMTPDQQQAFIRDKFGPLSTLLTPKEVSAELASFGANAGIQSILGTPLQDVPDEALSTGAQLAGQWIAKMRGPLNLIGNVANLRPEQWQVVAQTFKSMVGKGQNPAEFAAFMQALPASARETALGDTMKQLAQNGLFGSMAGYAAIIGSSIAYGTDGPARERLLAGDPKEVMTLFNNLAMTLSYAPSLVKGPIALMSAFGVKGADDLLARFKDLPDAGRMIGSYLTRFQPSFTDLGDALRGVNLTDEAAVKTALLGIDPTQSRKLINDFGYDYATLAKRISTHAQRYAPQIEGVGGERAAAALLERDFGVSTWSEATQGNYLKAFILDATGVDPNFRVLNKAKSILADNQALTFDDAGLRALFAQKGMTPEEITKVMSYAAVDPAAFAGPGAAPPLDPATPVPAGSIEIELSTAIQRHVGAPPVDGVTDLGNTLKAELDAKLALAPGQVAAPFEGASLGKFGLGVKGLAAGMDVIGGVAGVGTGIFDIVKGAQGDDKLRIVSGALGIGSGVAGTLGGLAGFGLIAGAAATPLFVVAGVLGLVSIFVSLFSGDTRTSTEKFADGLLERYRNDNIIRDGADRYLESWYLDNLQDRYVSDGGMS